MAIVGYLIPALLAALAWAWFWRESGKPEWGVVVREPDRFAALLEAARAAAIVVNTATAAAFTKMAAAAANAGRQFAGIPIIVSELAPEDRIILIDARALDPPAPLLPDPPTIRFE